VNLRADLVVERKDEEVVGALLVVDDGIRSGHLTQGVRVGAFHRSEADRNQEQNDAIAAFTGDALGVRSVSAELRERVGRNHERAGNGLRRTAHAGECENERGAGEGPHREASFCGPESGAGGALDERRTTVPFTTAQL